MSESCLLVGAGAEVGLGLPSGPKFLLDTYFTKKPTMYEALRDFYETKCTLPKGIPGYRAEYLFTPHSAAFHSLADNLNEVNLAALKGKKIFLTVPSLDTPVCDLEVRTFNSKASKIEGVAGIYTISMDLPFAQARWCGAKGVDKVATLSDYKYHSFAKATGTYINELGLLTRSVIIVDEKNKVIYTEYLSEITNEPQYDLALAALSK